MPGYRGGEAEKNQFNRARCAARLSTPAAVPNSLMFRDRPEVTLPLPLGA